MMVWVLWVLLLVLCCDGEDLQAENCSSALRIWTELGISTETAPQHTLTGTDLQVCVLERSCCSPQIEAELIERSKHQFEKLLDEATEDLRNTFVSRHKRFDEFFLELLDSTERSLNEMFLRTYGMPYVQNAEVFRSLFSDLKRFYSGGNASLDETLGDFWSRLLERMFQLLNSQFSFTDDYLECISKHSEQLQPFGDVPRKLRAQVSRAFIAARTFVQGLMVGREVANRVAKVSISTACANAVTKMLYCPYCGGLSEVKPCKSLCLNVLNNCLASLANLDPEWTHYIDAMLLVTEKLEGPFNIESVMEPIDVKISEAIMNMQDKSVQLSYQVFQGCGQPKPSEPSRAARALSEDFNTKFRPYSTEELPTAESSTKLQHLRTVWKAMQHSVLDVKEKLKQSKNAWSSLPQGVCEEEHVAVETEQEACWNGQEVGRFAPEVPEDRLSHGQNSEVLLDVSRPDSGVRQQVLALRVITNKLRNAYHGTDLYFQDSSDDNSGSGSGSGCTESCVTDPDGSDGSNSSEVSGSDPEPGAESSSALFHPSVFYLFLPSFSLILLLRR
ncbi:glypican-6b [Hoplias malabaricus]|uniref:glypican-6b n=1 Tax=Hoplias malabaricus TaxID=27720 RepID=UPI00346225AA